MNARIEGYSNSMRAVVYRCVPGFWISPGILTSQAYMCDMQLQWNPDPVNDPAHAVKCVGERNSILLLLHSKYNHKNSNQDIGWNDDIMIEIQGPLHL